MRVNRIKKNFLYQATYQIFVLMFPFLTSPYISRVLGAYGLGIYSYSYSIAYYFVLFSMLGVLNYGNREIAKVRDNRDKLNEVFSGLVVLHIGLSMICIVVYILYCVGMVDNKRYAFIQLFYVLSGLFDISWFYHGIEQFKTTVIRNIFIKVGTFFAIIIFIRNETDLWKYCLIMSLSYLLSQIVLWIPLHRYVSFVRVTSKQVMKHLYPMTLLFFPTVAVSLYKYMDKIMIGFLSSKVQLGYYENAENLVRVAVYIINSVGTVMLPQMSNLVSKGDMARFYYYFNKSMRYVMVLAIGMTFGLMAVANEFSLWFWGNDFKDVGRIVNILACTVPFVSFANVIRTQFLLPFEKDKIYVISVISGAMINLIVNFFLIPQYGAWGACIATVVTEISVCVIQAFQTRKNISIGRYLTDVIVFLIVGIIMYIVVRNIRGLCESTVLSLMVQALVGVFVYGVLSFLVLLSKKDEVVVKIVKKKIDI